jgi:hypothetical protein
MELITIVEPNATYYYQSDRFMVLNPKASIAIYPLESILPTTPPSDLSKWTEIPQDCTSTSITQNTIEINIIEQELGYRILIMNDTKLKAETIWLSSSKICSYFIQDIDSIEGPELIIYHKQPKGLFGITIFRIPEIINY